MEKYRIVYRHWKKPDVLLEVTGVELPMNPKSDRIVIKQDDGKHEDIIRSTIVSKEIVL